jgi:metallophosphoesterase superfamily enzyme
MRLSLENGRLAQREDVDAVVVMDGDGEGRPEDIAALCVAGHSHPSQVVLARRVARSEARVFRVG